MKKINIIVTRRKGESADVALNSLKNQTCNDFDVYVVEDKNGKGACWARNEGFLKSPESEFVLFSDNDIEWEPNAIEVLLNSITEHPEASYSYGEYEVPGFGLGLSHGFDAERLRTYNYISTMSLIRSRDFCGFDEGLKRFQDWDLWLSMLDSGKIGVFCGKKIFKTEMRNGITFGPDSQDPNIAFEIVKNKHKKNSLSRLNLGCGKHLIDGYVNLDKENGWKYEDGLPAFSSESVECITISHSLMYVVDSNWPKMFNEFARVMSRRGVIRITEDSSDNNKCERYGGCVEAVCMTSATKVRSFLESRGFYVVDVPSNFTVFKDKSIIQDLHGGEPKCFFVEGIKF